VAVAVVEAGGAARLGLRDLAVAAARRRLHFTCFSRLPIRLQGKRQPLLLVPAALVERLLQQTTPTAMAAATVPLQRSP
jgi:hypothetical protein